MLLNLILAQGTHFSQIFQISFRCDASPNPAETPQNPCRIALPRRFSASVPPGEPTESTGETPAGRNPDAPGSDARTFCKNLAARLHRPREKRICAFARKKRRPCVHFEKKHYLCPPKSGEMQEWLNWPAWKASKPPKGFRGSNPLLSAKRFRADRCRFMQRFFLFDFRKPESAESIEIMLRRRKRAEFQFRSFSFLPSRLSTKPRIRNRLRFRMCNNPNRLTARAIL